MISWKVIRSNAQAYEVSSAFIEAVRGALYKRANSPKSK